MRSTAFTTKHWMGRLLAVLFVALSTSTACGQNLTDGLVDKPSFDLEAIVDSLGGDDTHDTTPALPPAPSFQIPDTSLPSGWLPSRTQKLLNDYTGILTADQAAHIERRLLECNDTTSVQILVLLTPDLGGDDIVNFTQRLWEKWGVGDKKLNNGVAIVLKPKNSSAGEVRIQTGYGMEGALPDAFCRHIIDHQMIPKLINNDYYGAIDAALDVIIPVCAGEYSYEQAKQNDSEEGVGASFIIILIIIVIIFIIYSRHHPNQGSSSNSSRGGDTFWGGSTWGGSFGGGGSFGSSGGFGGFGGFGGGSSGGGGASGRW